PLSREEYRVAQQEVALQLGVTMDRATTDPARIYFPPIQLLGGPFESREATGEVLALGELLASASARTDTEVKATRPTGRAGMAALARSEWPTFRSAVTHLASVDTKGGYSHDYVTWRNVCFAIAHAFGKREEGLETFDEFSKS